MTMDKRTKGRLESAGWKIGEASEFLGLSAEAAAILELGLNLAKAVRERRIRRNLSQEQLARMLGSSQSRVAKDGGCRSVGQHRSDDPIASADGSKPQGRCLSHCRATAKACRMSNTSGKRTSVREASAR